MRCWTVSDQGHHNCSVFGTGIRSLAHIRFVVERAIFAIDETFLVTYVFAGEIHSLG